MINACELCETIELEQKENSEKAKREAEERFVKFCENKLDYILRNHRNYSNYLDAHYFVDKDDMFCSNWGGWYTKYYNIHKINEYLSQFGLRLIDNGHYMKIEILCPKY